VPIILLLPTAEIAVMEPQELSLKEINEAEDHEAKLLGKEAEY
jgi:hypothetical protein